MTLYPVFVCCREYADFSSFHFLNYSQLKEHRVVLLGSLDVLMLCFFLHSVSLAVTLFQD